MIKIIKFLFIATIAFLLFNFIAQNNGTVEIKWLDFEIKTSVAVSIVVIATISYAISKIFGATKTFQRRSRRKRKKH